MGNTAFRDLWDKLSKVSVNLISNCLPEDKKDAAVELNTYFLDSFGSNIRIDYGTGHELAFITFLYCLRELG